MHLCVVRVFPTTCVHRLMQRTVRAAVSLGVRPTFVSVGSSSLLSSVVSNRYVAASGPERGMMIMTANMSSTCTIAALVNLAAGL